MGFEKKTIRIAMNGVTGRMGYRQHLVRSILPIRDRAGSRWPTARRVQVEPILVGRNEAKITELAGAAQGRSTGAPTSTRSSPIPAVDVVFDASMTSLRAATLGTAMQRRQARLHREADRRDPGGGGGAGAAGQGSRHHRRRRARQAVPARAWSSSAGWWTRGSSAASSPCEASSATGSSRATARRPSVPPGTTARKTAAE